MKLLCDFSEINWVFADSASIETFLQKIVTMVAKHMQAHVSSIYLYDEAEHELTLRATQGLNPDAVNRVKLRLGEGITGLALKELRPVTQRGGEVHPNFKAIPGIFEENFESFLAVPIVRGVSRVGVLTAQRVRERNFTDEDVMAMRAIASQLANILENAKLLMGLEGKLLSPTREESLSDLKFLKGKKAAPGFAYAPTRVVDRGRGLSFLYRREIQGEYGLEDFRRALSATEQQLSTLQTEIGERLSDAASLIFTSHLLILKDRRFVGAIEEMIEEGINPPEAVRSVAEKYVEAFSKSSDPYIKEKASDLLDLALRLFSNIIEDTGEVYTFRDRVVVARDLFPSDFLRMSSEGVAGIVMATGGVTSHLSILARSLRIPMVIVDEPRLLGLPESSLLLLDAELGNIYVNPSEEVVSAFNKRNEARSKADAGKLRMEPVSHTRDGVRVRLLANINLLTDLDLAREMKCEGIGLYRTEFPFIIRSDFPCEEEQYVVYRKLIEACPGKPITLRTLDIGGDKVLSYFPRIREQNPFLGLRSIRFTLKHKDILVAQVRAMLRAGKGADLRIMFPMISSIEEFRRAKDVVRECIADLTKEKVEHNSKPGIGMMVEVPSVVDLADDFARQADFFSLGTNDFIQYLLAVDRTNEKVGDLYIPHHPAVLRSLKRVADAALRADIELSVCGDMAHDVRLLPFLLGIGVRHLSMAPVYLPKAQRAVLDLSYEDAGELTGALIRANEVREVERLLEKTVPRGVPTSRGGKAGAGRDGLSNAVSR